MDEETLRKIIREEITKTLKPDPGGWLTPQETAEYAKVTKHTLRNWRKNGLKCETRGRVVRYRGEWVDEYLGKSASAQDIFEKAVKKGK